MFFTFDGVDGAGKSTQTDLFCEWLREQGHDVVTCRDPGSTDASEAIRQLLLSGEVATIGRRCEMLLYMAARAELVDEVIAPALASGKTIVSDRYLLANVVYQGHAGGLDIESIWQVGQLATKGIVPDLTVVLDIDPEAAAARRTGPPDRMESQGSEFRTRLRKGFQAEAERSPKDIVVINAAQTVEQIQSEIRAAATRVLPSST
jgi:dTMP kinase